MEFVLLLLANIITVICFYICVFPVWRNRKGHVDTQKVNLLPDTNTHTQRNTNSHTKIPTHRDSCITVFWDGITHGPLLQILPGYLLAVLESELSTEQLVGHLGKYRTDTWEIPRMSCGPHPVWGLVQDPLCYCRNM